MTFEGILDQKLGKKRERRIPASIVSLVKQKGLDLRGTTFEVSAKEGFSAEDIEASALSRVEDIIEGVISEDILDHRVFGRPKKTRRVGKVKVSGGLFGIRDKRGRFIGAFGLARLLNLVLFKYVQARMRAPKLINRTGRFAHSAHITRVLGGTNIEEQREKGVSVMFSYMIAPYSIFENREPWSNGGLRSPIKLIKEAVDDALLDLVHPTSLSIIRTEADER